MGTNPTAARQCVHKAAFPELRNAFLRFGGNLTAKFLELEREIDTTGSSLLRCQLQLLAY